MTTPPKTDLTNLELEVDLSLCGNGVVITDEWMSIPLEGTFHPVTSEEIKPSEKHMNKMPLYREDGDIV